MGRVSRAEFVLDQCHIQLINNMFECFCNAMAAADSRALR